jgi:protein O-mannosyl-transferase
MSKKQKSAVPPMVKSNPIAISQSKAITQSLQYDISYNYLLAGFIALVGFLLYTNTFGHDYVLDDQAAITYNNYVQEGFAGIPKLMKVDFWYFMNLNLGYYRPLSLITFAIEHQFVGANDPHISHIINAIFYSITGFVLCLMLQRWFANRNAAFATLIALLFITFPTHTEVVANIKSRDELLSFLNMATTLLLFTSYLDSGKLKHLWCSLLTAYLAYLSKESSIIMLGIFPLIAYYLRGRSFGNSLAQMLPYLGITLVFFIQKKVMLGTLGGQPPMDLMVYPYAVEKTKFLSMFKQFAHYLRIIFVPYALVYDYSYNQIPSGKLSDPVTWIGIVSFFGLIYLGIKGFVKRTVWGFGIALFFATLFPALAFTIMRGGIMAERFLYAPSLSWCLLLGYGVVFFISKKEENDTDTSWLNWLKANTIAVVVLLVVSGLYALKTWTRNPAWKEEYTLFLADEEFTPDNTNARKHLGDATIRKFQDEKDPVRKQKLFNDGIRNLKRSIAIYPTYGEAHFGIGFAYQHAYPKPIYDSALYYYKKTTELTPRFVVSYNNIGVIYELTGRIQQASYWYNKAIEVNPNYVNAVNNRNRMLQAGINVTSLPDNLMLK